MKILFVLEHYYPYLGGAEKLFKQLAEAYQGNGCEVVVVTTRFDNALAVKETVKGINIRRVNCSTRFLFTVQSLPAIWKNARDADLIITTTYNAALPAWIVSKLKGIRTLLVFHEYWGKLWFKLPYLSSLERLLFYNYERTLSYLPFHQYIAVSKATQEALIEAGIPKEKITHIYNGIDYQAMAPFRWKPEPGFTVIYYGRLGVSKGLDLLLPAWKAFHDQSGSGKLQLVIPRYPDKFFRRIQAAVQQLGISDSIECLHELDKTVLFQLVAKAQAVVIPSYSEGFCFVAAEAMAIGTPIISSGQGALSEVVNGTHIRMENQSIEALTTALEDAYNNKWNETPARKFPLQDAISQYLDLLRKG